MKAIYLRHLLAGIAATILIVGCGGSEEEGSDQGSAAAPSGQSQSAQSSQGAAASDSARRDCPAEPTSAPRAEGAPVDDIVGVRPGMSYDDVLWVLACRGDVPTVQTAEKWNVRQTHGITTRQLMRASDGQPCSGQEVYSDKVDCNYGGMKFRALKNISNEFIVAFTGLPGAEKTGAIWRRTVFAEGESPTVEMLTQSLSEKYGPPHKSEQIRRGAQMETHHLWIFDFLGRPASKASPAFRQCDSISATFAGDHSWSTGCGLTIKAAIQPVEGNELLARELDIGVMNQKDFYEAGEQFARDLAAAAAARKQEEAAEAAKGATSPDL